MRSIVCGQVNGTKLLYMRMQIHVKYMYVVVWSCWIQNMVTLIMNGTFSAMITMYVFQRCRVHVYDHVELCRLFMANIRAHFCIILAHTPDNSFMGFVVPKVASNPLEKQNIGVLYGKDKVYFEVTLLQYFEEIFHLSLQGHRLWPV